jgi:hypothetical protein
MKLRDLIEALEDCEECVGENAEVLLMTQEHWPFEFSIRTVVTRDQIDEADIGHGEGHETDVFIVEGTQLRYGNKRAWDR